jgi:hypothetical protein
MSMPHPDAERLALAALPAEPRDPLLAEHINGCEQCREHVTGLRRTVDLARTGHANRAAPPPRVWQAIIDELEDLGEPNLPANADPAAPDPASGGPDRPGPPGLDPTPNGPAGSGPLPPDPTPPGPSRALTTPTDPTRFGRRRRWRRALVPAIAAAAGLAAGLVIGVTAAPTPDPPAATVLAQLRPVGTLDAAATGAVDGVTHDGVQELVIRVDGVTDTAGGEYLEAWMMDPTGTRLISLGALTRTADGSYHGDFTLPTDLPTAAFTVVDISAERWDGDPTHSRISLLRGTMA